MICQTSPYDHVMSLMKELLVASAWEDRIQALFTRVQECLNGSGSAYLTDSLQRVTDVKSLGRLRSSSSSTLVDPVTRRATLADSRPGMKRSTRLRHSSANCLITLHCYEDLSVLRNFLTLTTHVILLTLWRVFVALCAFTTLTWWWRWLSYTAIGWLM